MAQSAEQIYQEKASKKKSDGGGICESEFLTELSVGNSINSNNISSRSSSSSSSSSSSASDMIEDATSPTSSSSPSYGPLYELSELIAQLPIKRGLSKYYEGKAQTFGSLASVKSLEDLAKKGRSWRTRKTVKSASSKSYGGRLDINGIFRRPRAAISRSKSKKKMSSSTSRVSISLASSSSSMGRGRCSATKSLMSSCSPRIPIHKSL